MKNFFAFVTCLLLASSPIAAQQAPAVMIGSDAAAFLVPIAGHVLGQGNAPFATDVTIVNFGQEGQRVELEWIPRTGPAARAEVTIPYLSYRTLYDVVLNDLKLTGVGAILVRAIDAEGEADPAAQIDGFARIWTTVTADPQKGSASQSLVPMRLDGWRPDSPAYMHGARQNGQFRTNVGIVNLDRAHSRTFKLIVNSAVGKIERTYAIAPFSMILEPVPFGPWGDLSIYVEPLGSGGDWRAFASTVDNSTQSGWIVPGVQTRTDVIFPQ